MAAYGSKEYVKTASIRRITTASESFRLLIFQDRETHFTKNSRFKVAMPKKRSKTFFLCNVLHHIFKNAKSSLSQANKEKPKILFPFQ